MTDPQDGTRPQGHRAVGGQADPVHEGAVPAVLILYLQPLVSPGDAGVDPGCARIPERHPAGRIPAQEHRFVHLHAKPDVVHTVVQHDHPPPHRLAGAARLYGERVARWAGFLVGARHASFLGSMAVFSSKDGRSSLLLNPGEPARVHRLDPGYEEHRCGGK